MIVLNLAKASKSDVGYKITSFPDGQKDITIDPDRVLRNASGVEIHSRFNSMEDLGLIVAATKCLRRLFVKNIALKIPYILGARSDRKFKVGGNIFVVDVIAPIINAQNYEYVTVLDPHSDVVGACINNINVIDNTQFAREALCELGFWGPTRMDGKHGLSGFSLISPDAGASKKIYPVAQYINHIGSVHTASKHREILTGEILSTELPNIDKDIQDDKSFVIIDDICDGGRTFIELAKVIKDRIYSINQVCAAIRYTNKIYLVVTHGIFSAGFEELGKYFDRIVTTNSIKDIEDPLVIQLETI